MARRGPALAVWLALGSPAARAQEVQGYAEVIGVGYFGVEGVPFQFAERVRPEFSADLGEQVRLVGTLDAVLAQGRDLQSEVQRTFEQSDLGPLLEVAGCTWPEPENGVLHIDGVQDYLEVDRLYVDFYSEAADVRIGRHAVQWGSALIFHPTDPFPEVFLTDPWANRQGVNAVRATLPLGGFNNQVQLLLGLDDRFKYARVAGRVTVNALQTDWSLVGAYRGELESGFLGLDIRGTAGVGFWLETALHGKPAGPQELGAGTDWRWELAVGLDYSFPVLESLLVQAQYYRSGLDPEEAGRVAGLPAGAIQPPDCGEDSPFPAPVEVDPFAPFVTKVNYGVFTVTLAATPDLSFLVNVLHGFDDGTGLFLPAVTYRPTGWLQATLNLQLPYDLTPGNGGELRPADEDLVLEVPDLPIEVDLSGLVPSATLILWLRASF